MSKDVSAPTQPGDAVALLRECRDWIALRGTVDLLARIDAHLSSAKSAGAQEPCNHVPYDNECARCGRRMIFAHGQWWADEQVCVPIPDAAASAKAGYVSVPVEPTK